MRHATRVLSLMILAASVAPLAGSRADAQCGRGGSYTATGAALMAYDPPSQFVGGFAQMYQAPTTPVYYRAAAITSTPTQPVYATYRTTNPQWVMTQVQQPTRRVWRVR